jgi:rhodanese-related sulfurtransferase
MMGWLKTLAWAAIKALIHLRFPQVRSLTVTDLADRLRQDSPPLLLDARTPAEYQVSHLPGARLVPDSLDQLRGWPDFQNHRPIVVYCSVGYRSARLVEQLQSMGFDPVFNLEGSIFEWANAGHPVYCGQTVVHQVHPYNSRWGQLLRSDLWSDV